MTEYATPQPSRRNLKIVLRLVLILAIVAGGYYLVRYAFPLEIFKLTKSDFQMTEGLIGTGTPNRPAVAIKSNTDPKFEEGWKKHADSSSISQIEELLDGTDGWQYWSAIRAGLAPWIVKLHLDDGAENHCISGGLVQAENIAIWARAAEGEYGLSGPDLPASWEVVYRPGNISMLSEPNSDIRVWKSVIARVPDLQGEQTLRVTGKAQSPNESKEVSHDYPLKVDPTPRPDRGTLVAFWAYVVTKGTKIDSDFPMHIDQEARMLAKFAVAILIQFEEELDGDLKTFAGELLGTSSFKTGVRNLLAD